jgi:hypothetical protein
VYRPSHPPARQTAVRGLGARVQKRVFGIDIGPVELVCQIGPPRSIATFLQRVGRSNHSRSGTPKGRVSKRRLRGVRRRFGRLSYLRNNGSRQLRLWTLPWRRANVPRSGRPLGDPAQIHVRPYRFPERRSGMYFSSAFLSGPRPGNVWCRQARGSPCGYVRRRWSGTPQIRPVADAQGNH